MSQVESLPLGLCLQPNERGFQGLVLAEGYGPASLLTFLFACGVRQGGGVSDGLGFSRAETPTSP